MRGAKTRVVDCVPLALDHVVYIAYAELCGGRAIERLLHGMPGRNPTEQVKGIAD